MSELKVYHCNEWHNEYTEFYMKDEAYKVITHNKYKRCLAMAMWCERNRIDAANYRIQRRKWDFYKRWHKRWLKLAEKFKPNSTAR